MLITRLSLRLPTNRNRIAVDDSDRGGKNRIVLLKAAQQKNKLRSFVLTASFHPELREGFGVQVLCGYANK